MFENDYTLTGKHATYAKFLKDEAKLYERIVDVYMNGAVFGLLYNRRAPKNNDLNDRVRIYADAFANNRAECVFLYRLVMLLEKKTDLDEQARIDRAFRDDADEEKKDKLEQNLDLFNEYVRGGIEVMYERFIEGAINQKDYLERALEFMEQFHKDLSGDSLEEQIESLIK